MQIITEAIIAVFLLFIWKFAVKESFINLGLTRKNRWKDLILGLFIGAFSIFFVYEILILTDQLSISSIDFSIILTPKYILYIFLYIVVGFYEELLSRGFIVHFLKRTRNIYAIILISSVIFSLLHIFNQNVVLLGLLNIFIVGILFALMLYKRGSLWMPIGFHITWNFFQGNVLGLNVSGNESYSIINNSIFGNNLLTGGNFGAEGGIATTFIIGILVIVFLILKKKDDPNLWSIKLSKN
ncbi:MAG: CPBP family intramembrane metalloprotease [Oscillospiraceae bacterium]|nr:CPBP family intramembrane metalloprotease [Oscillospiraceae bacterium]